MIFGSTTKTWSATAEKRLSDAHRDILFDPVGYHDTEDVHGEFDRDKLAARCVLRGFGGPDWGDGVQNPSANTVEHPSWRSHDEPFASVEWHDGVGANLPQRVQSLFCELHWRQAPMIDQTVPTAMVLVRPILSPIQPPKKAPRRHPGR